MKPVSLLQLDWHLTKEASEILQTLYQPNSFKLRQFGLLERPQLELDEVNYKLFVCGKGGIGKTTLIARLSGNEVSTSYCETPGIQISVVYWPVKLLNTSRIVMFRLEFWDAGEGALKKFDHILPACKEDLDALIFVFSFTDRSSFEEIPQQLSKIFQPTERPCPIIFGTRFDQHSMSEVTLRDVRDFEQRWKIPIIKLKNNVVDSQSSKSLQASELSEIGLALNIVCNHLWQRDQSLAGITVTQKTQT
uniref:Ciliogenesis and planar polarity effector 2 n=1 Tax=Strigamia maritima TaxID=126957 RepID=T1JBK2_STRMM